MIELEDITKIYPMGATEVRALDGVSLRVDAGEFLAIMGSSGSGKSTLMHLLGCLDRPSGGTYRLLGETASSLNDRQLARIRNRSIGFVFQTFNLISRMSAWENVAVPLFYARQTVTKPRALEALERVGLGDRAHHQPNELSGGERQRVAIARAIVNRPRLILADEPTGNLDTSTGEQIMGIFRDLHAAGTTLVLVTHEADIAKQALRIVSMRDGKIVKDSTNGPRTLPRLPADNAAQVAGNEQPAKAAGSAGDADAVLHPNARRALNWMLIGIGCLVGLAVWIPLANVLRQINPGFVKSFGPLLSIGLLTAMFVAPILGLVHGRRGARWVRLAPARFTGLRRARVAQWVSGIQLLLATGFVALAIVGLYVAVKTGHRPT